MSDQENLQEPLLERQSSSPELLSDPASKKRKRSATKNAGAAGKKKKKSKTKDLGDNDLNVEMCINNAFSHMDNQLLSDYIAQRTNRHENDLSSIELEDKYLPAQAIEDTTAYDKLRTLDNLPHFLERFAGSSTKLWSASKKNGSPHTIIVTGSGLRAAEVARTVRRFQTKDATVAKLFAKHIKLQDSIKFLNSTRTGIAVGTPFRLKELMNDGALAVDRLERIVVDASHIDTKKRGILEMKDTQVPLMLWLGTKEFRERYGMDKDGIQLLFF